MGNRIYGLDILRAIAILTVLYHHSHRYLKDYFDKTIFHALLPDGVTLFFVLSGYLIGHILLREFSKPEFSTKSLLNFWKRRWFRTLPAYLVVLTGIYFAGVITESGRPIGILFSYSFFLQSFLSGSASMFPESWSLCVEEWFYLAVPFFFFLSLKLSDNKRLIVLFWIIFIILGITGFRIYRATEIPADVDSYNTYIRTTVFTRLDAIMFGVLGAYLSYYKHPAWNRFPIQYFIIGIILFILLSIDAAFHPISTFVVYYKLTLESVATLMLIPFLSGIKNGNGRTFRFFTFISLISYSLYLVNYTPFNYIQEFLVKMGMDHSIFFLLGFFLWSLMAAYFLFYFVERPMMQIRERFTWKKMKLGIAMLRYICKIRTRKLCLTDYQLSKIGYGKLVFKEFIWQSLFLLHLIQGLKK